MVTRCGQACIVAADRSPRIRTGARSSAGRRRYSRVSDSEDEDSTTSGRSATNASDTARRWVARSSVRRQRQNAHTALDQRMWRVLGNHCDLVTDFACGANAR